MSWKDILIAVKKGIVASKESVDNIQTANRTYLSSAGWYRVAEYSGTQFTINGSTANSCDLIIKRSFANTNNEQHFIRLLSANGVKEFVSLGSISRTQAFTKVRYTRDVPNLKAYIEVYYGATTSEMVHFAVNNAVDGYTAWKAITPILTEETVDGVTVDTTYDIPANASPVTTVDTGGITMLTALPNGITSDSTMLELIAALPNNSILDVKSVSTPLTPKSYSQLFVFKGNASYFTAIAKSQYDSTISVGGSDTQNGWTGWQTVSTIADLANYLNLNTGGDISGILGHNAYGHRLIHQIRESGNYSFWDTTKAEAVFSVPLSGTNTFNGTASGNLALRGGTVGDGSSNYPILAKGDGCSFIEFSNSTGTVKGALGVYTDNNPSYIPGDHSKAYTLHHDGNSAKVVVSETPLTAEGSVRVW